MTIKLTHYRRQAPVDKQRADGRMLVEKFEAVDTPDSTQSNLSNAGGGHFMALAEQLSPFATETCAPRDPLYDYTMRPYAAGVDQTGRLRSSTLLYQLLAGSRQKDAWQCLIAGLREKLGLHRTIWGAKYIDGRIGAELYFYFRTLSSARGDRDPRECIPEPITFAQVADALAPTVRILPTYPAHAPAIMVSIDMDDTVLARGEIEELHVYMQSGLSWNVRADRIEHANHYEFFELSEVDRLRALIERQANGLLHASACGVDIAQLLLPRLYNCRTICLAAKRQADGIYFAGIDTEQLRWFMDQFDWPQSTRSFLAMHADDFAHIRWDVGLDFVAAGAGFRWVKSGVYGTL